MEYLLLIPLLLTLVLGLIYFTDQRFEHRAKLRQDLADRESRRWLSEHRLSYDSNGNPTIHIGDLELEYFALAPGNPAGETKILFSNGNKIEVRPDRPPDIYKGSKGFGGTPDKPAEPVPELEPPEPEPELEPVREVKLLAEPEPELTDLQIHDLLIKAKADGYNQKEAVYLVTGLRKGGAPLWKKWATIYNQIEL